MKNVEIRDVIKRNRIFFYEIAAELGVSEYTFCRWLRQELTDEKKAAIFAALDRLTEQGTKCSE